MSSHDHISKILEGVCRIIEHLTALLCRDEIEWQAWGKRFVIGSAMAIRWGDHFLVQSWLEARSESFSSVAAAAPTTSMAKGWESQRPFDHDIIDSEWQLVFDRAEYLSKLVLFLGSELNRVAIASVLQRISYKAFSNGEYDARCRSIIRNLINILRLPEQMLADLESHCVATSTYFSASDVQNIGEALTPFRMSKVCAVTLSTGALMYGVGVLTAPAIIMALVNTASVGAIAGEILGTSAVTCATTVARAAAVGGAGVAYGRMVHRTEVMSQFRLEPLFSPLSKTEIDPKEAQDAQQSLINTIESQFFPQSGNNDIDSISNAKQFTSIESVGAGSEDLCLASAVVLVDKPGESLAILGAEKGLKPVFFLIPGHIGRDDDLKNIFGGPRLAALSMKEDDMNRSTVLQEPHDNNSENSYDLLNTVLSMESACIVHKSSSWWRELIPRGEEYILHWERVDLGDVSISEKIKSFVEGEVVSTIMEAAIQHFALTALWGSFGWTKLVMDELAELDGPWAIALDRSQQAGRMLARLLIAKKFCHSDDLDLNSDSFSKFAASVGCDVVNESISLDLEDAEATFVSRNRPVTLIGYGMGARVIYHCLEELDAAPGLSGRGIVENAVLMGAPVGTDISGWTSARKVVASRLINCYSKRDWFLALMYRSNVYEPMVAGLQSFSLIKSTAYGIKVGGMCYLAPPPNGNGADSRLPSAPSNKAVGLGYNAEVTLPTKTATSIAEQSANGKYFQMLSHFSEDIECIDVTHLISCHTDYPSQLDAILSLVNLEPCRSSSYNEI